MPENTEEQVEDVVDDGGQDAADWVDVDPTDLTFDSIWNESVARQQAKQQEPEDAEGDEPAEEAPAEEEKTEAGRVKVGREELEIGEGPGQWTRDQVDLLQRYKREADQQKSSAQSLEAAVDRMSRENAQVVARLEAIETGSHKAPSAQQAPSGEDFLQKIAALDNSLGADGQVRDIISGLYNELNNLKQQASQIGEISSTTREIDFERRFERESAGLWQDITAQGVDPSDVSFSWSEAPEGTTPYSYGQAWMLAFQRNLREKQGLKDEEINSPAWLAAARNFALTKVLGEAYQAVRGKTNRAEPARAAASPRSPLATQMRPRTTISAGSGASRQHDAPEVLSDEDRALIPL